MITLIAAVSKNNAIGKDNQLLWRLKDDLAFFKQQTLNKPIIMGRKTFLSLPKALPNRLNIVLTKSNQTFKGAITAASIENALGIAKAQNMKRKQHEIMVIGGGEIYQAFMGIADKMLITHVNCELEGDTYFPKTNAEWVKTHLQSFSQNESNQFSFEIIEYTRKPL